MAFLFDTIRWIVRHSVYRIHTIGEEHMPRAGPALLVSNHVSYLDGFLIGACVPKMVRYVVNDLHYNRFRGILRILKAIPIPYGVRKDLVSAIQQARQELRDGNILCIFAEGAVTRTGNLLRFHRGFERVSRELDAPVIPVFIDGMWGSVFSFRDGRILRKRPRGWIRRVTVSFGPALSSQATAWEVRQAVLELGARAASHWKSADELLPVRVLQAGRKHWFRQAVADSTGRELTYGRMLAAAMLLAAWLRRHRPGEEMTGILLPASVGAAVANLGVLLAGSAPVNLNFTLGHEALESAVAQCGIKTILTSRKLLSKSGIDQTSGMIFLEDVKDRFSAGQKVAATLKARLAPAPWLRRQCGGGRKTPDDVATVIFSSGSTGEPKGVLLSHRNVLANLESVSRVFPFRKSDTLAGVLPFFHSFGFTVTLWLPLLAGGRVAYHPNPLDAKGVGSLVEENKATFLVAMPTFCAAYLRGCSREQFATLRLVLTGGEKLQPALARHFEERFGVAMREGYGCTEMGPVVAVNVDDAGEGVDRQKGTKPGTVGHPIPGVAVRVIDIETKAPLPPQREGILLVSGPNRMLGYLGRPEKTEEAVQDGWYVTGDVGAVDADGFLQITDRLARFSKVAGEMVPQIKIEDAIRAVLGAREAAVVSVQDERRGERLVAFYAVESVEPGEVWERLSASDLPKLWIPHRDDIHRLESLPTLSTGKTNLRALREMANQKRGNDEN